MIVKRKAGYFVLSEKTKRNLGGPYKQSLKTPFESELSNFVYKTRDEAKKTPSPSRILQTQREMKPNVWQIGKVKISQVIETVDGKDIQEGLPDATSEKLLKIPWLKPHFIDSEGNFKAQVSSFILETDGLKIVIDTGVGNNKIRKNFPAWNNLDTDFLERFKKIIPDRNKINYVICTHLHFDHVGWNTMHISGKWLPTFPNARYLFVKEEFNYWKDFPSKEMEDDHEGIRDSILPIYKAGLVELIPADYEISKSVSLISTPGHTPGHVSILIKSDGKQAVITGDVLHHPSQLVHPEWEANFDTDKKKARLSRENFLNKFADTETFLIGTHFASPTGGILRRDGESFKLKID